MPPLVVEEERKSTSSTNPSTTTTTTTTTHHHDDEIDFTLQNSVERLLTDDICEEYSMCPKALKELRSIIGNDICIDCGKSNPEWASVNLGIFMCLECSGQHRSLGTHISFVRSVKMDSWSEPQLQIMFLGGNKQCTEFLQSKRSNSTTTTTTTTTTCDEDNNNNNDDFDDDDDSLSISQKYDCAATILYQQILKARRDGQPEPTELPDYTPSSSRSSSSSSSKSSSRSSSPVITSRCEGFGNTSTTTTTTSNNNNNKKIIVDIDEVLENAIQISQNSIGTAVSLWENIIANNVRKTRTNQIKTNI